MASTYSDLKIELIGTGEQTGTWGTTTNNNFSIAIGEAITGSADVSFSSADVTVTLTDTNAAQTARNLRLNLTGTSGGARNLILGSGCQIEKLYLINNGLADAVTVKNTSGTGIAVPAGKTMFVYNNGTNVVEAVNSAVTLDVTTLDATNIEVTNIKAKDGTAAGSIANSTGVVTLASSVLTTTDINGGTIDNTAIGGSTAAAGKFTTLEATGVATFSAGAVGTPAITTTGDTNTGIFFPAADTIAFTEGGTESMRIDSSGNVGVNNTSPAVLASTTQIAIKANVSADSMFVAQNSNGLTTAKFGFQFTGSVDQPVIGSQTNHPFLFLTNNTERMRITSGGDLLIGTTNSDARLTVVTGSDEAVYALNTAGANSATMLAWNNAGSGNNYFHAFFVNASPLNVGNIDYNRAGALVRYNTTSDATLKNIFGDSDGQKSVGILKSTRIREYAWKEDAEQKPQIGVIAQELYETYKGAVSVGGENDKGEYRPWGVDKTAFTFHLIAGWQNHEKLIQEQQTLIQNLTTRLNALEGN